MILLNKIQIIKNNQVLSVFFDSEKKTFAYTFELGHIFHTETYYSITDFVEKYIKCLGLVGQKVIMFNIGGNQNYKYTSTIVTDVGIADGGQVWPITEEFKKNSNNRLFYKFTPYAWELAQQYNEAMRSYLIADKLAGKIREKALKEHGQAIWY